MNRRPRKNYKKVKEQFRKISKTRRRIIIFIVLIFIAVFGFYCFFRWVFAVADSGKGRLSGVIEREQEEAIEKVDNLLEELENGLNELEKELNALDQERARWLTVEKRRELLLLIDKIEDQSRRLEKEYITYESDVTIQAYPFRNEGIDQVIIKAWYLTLTADRLVRRAEFLVFSGKMDKEQLRVVENELARIRGCLEEIRQIDRGD
ncbi:MAG: hypothetical protein ABIC19_00315 [Patescibacteria group bacterium]|nr:hypothetical protein [Patescibacteria group bacterium]